MAAVSTLKNLLIWLGVIVAVIVADQVVVPFLSELQKDILVYAGINIILAVSLNLVNGFTGQFSIGHAGFMAVGAYCSAFLSIYFRTANPGIGDDPAMSAIYFLVALVAGGLLAAVMGYIVGLPSLRLKGDYLAIVTLGFGEIIRVILLNMNIVGGARGLPGIPKMTSLVWVYVLAVVTVFTIRRVIISGHGRSLLAVREDEIAAENVGVNTTTAKVRAFVLGAFFAGIAGGLFSHYLTFLNPAIFDFNRSFEIIIMVVLGGLGSITGSIVAALFLTFLKEYLRDLQELTKVDLRMILFSLILIILMLTRPNGLFGTNELSHYLRRFKKEKA